LFKRKTVVSERGHQANWYARSDVKTDDKGNVVVVVELWVARHDGNFVPSAKVTLSSLCVNGEDISIEEVFRMVERGDTFDGD
jgi:hypothetical protein